VILNLSEECILVELESHASQVVRASSRDRVEMSESHAFLSDHDDHDQGVFRRKDHDFSVQQND